MKNKEIIDMEGFFPEYGHNTGRNQIEQDPCGVCGLYKKCKSPKMNWTGEGKKKVLIISEAPGQSEDEDWKKLGYNEPTQLIGDAGQLLRSHIKSYGLDLDRDFWKLNSINCRPPENRKPSRKEIKCCRFMIERAIEELQPEMIWLLGGYAVISFYQGIYSHLEINTWRKFCFPDPRYNTWIIPMYHPSYILRNEGNKNLESTYERDIKWSVSCIGKKRPEIIDFEKQVICLYEHEDVMNALETIYQEVQYISFDYETTNLKPYGEGQKIWSISVNGYSFPYQYGVAGKPYWSYIEHREIEELWIEILLNDEIKKVAHNLKFEDQWSRIIFDIPEVRGWHWCTMNAAHIIDERKYYSNLNFQAIINFGVLPYDEDVKKHIKSKGDFNTLDEVPLEKLLLYGGKDERITNALWRKQEKLLSKRNDSRKKAYDFFHEGLLAFSDAQSVGICIDKEYYLKTEKELQKKVKLLEVKILNGKEALLFRRRFGRDLKFTKEISPKDLRDLFFDVLKMKSIKKTATGLESVDKDVLGQMDSPFSKRIVKRRVLLKTLSYIDQYKREEVDSKIHPFFDLHTARSFRSSSSSPNFHNIPVRNKEAKKAVRQGIIPSKGRKIGSADFSGVEVRGVACYSLDPVLINEINSGVDMHFRMAKDLFLLKDNQVTKDIRFYSKNQFVFPEFYGSFWKNCAYNLWENCSELETREGVVVKDHLEDKGIRNINDFIEHVRVIEKEFWDRYVVYEAWKEMRIKQYLKKGYIDTFFGHRRGGFLSINQLLNTPIQATSFHWLLWSFVKINHLLKKWNTNLIGQIHDELIMDLDPKEEDEVWQQTKYIMTEKIREVHPWIIVPLRIDAEVTEVNGSWYTKKSIEI